MPGLDAHASSRLTPASPGMRAMPAWAWSTVQSIFLPDSQGGAGEMGESEERMGKALNVLGLLLNLAGVVLLFLFGMPFSIATSGTAVTWTMSNIDLQVKKLDDLFSVLGWIGLLAIALGTLLQVWATVERR